VNVLRQSVVRPKRVQQNVLVVSVMIVDLKAMMNMI
jgi:hypothetical protein